MSKDSDIFEKNIYIRRYFLKKKNMYTQYILQLTNNYAIQNVRELCFL